MKQQNFLKEKLVHSMWSVIYQFTILYLEEKLVHSTVYVKCDLSIHHSVSLSKEEFEKSIDTDQIPSDLLNLLELPKSDSIK